MNSFVHYSKCLLLMIIFFNQLIVGQLVDIAFHNALLINDKLYFLGGYSESSGLTNQLIYLDLSKTFKINYDSNDTSLPIKTASPNSPPPPFSSAAVVLGRGVKDGSTIYLIGGMRGKPYGNLAYSIDSKFLNTWRPLNINNDAAASLGLSSSTNTIFAQDDDNNKVYVLGGSIGSGLYDIDLNIMNITVIGQNVINPTSYPMFFTSHIINNKNIIFVGKDLTQLSIFNIDDDTWNTVNAIGDKPSQRSMRHSSVLTSDGRIIVYGGTLEDDKLVVLDTTNFQWTIPNNINNITSTVNGGHYGHSATLYRDNYMIVAFGRRLGPTGYVYDSNIIMLDISDKNNYKWLDSFDPLPEPPPPTTTSNNGNNTLLILRIVLGATSALALVILGIYLIVRYNRKKRQNTVSPQIAVKPENNKDENENEKVVVIGIDNGDDVASKKDDKDANNTIDSKDVKDIQKNDDQ